MIKFENRAPAPPLSRLERALIGLAMALSIYGFAATLLATARTLGRLLTNLL